MLVPTLVNGQVGIHKCKLQVMATTSVSYVLALVDD